MKEQITPEDEDLFEDFAEEGVAGLQARQDCIGHQAVADQGYHVEEQHPEVDTKLPLWTADWDDEDAAEDFAVKLKAELQKHRSGSSGTMDTTS